ncbi:MAG: TATA-box-binding protein, partial [Candidatus Saliniplasma sp.]
ERDIETAEDITVTIQNIVASYSLEADLNLSSVAITLGLERVEYEPEQFPGLVYRLRESPVVLLLFGSGKMVCTGGKTIEDLEDAVELIKDELKGAGLIH